MAKTGKANDSAIKARNSTLITFSYFYYQFILIINYLFTLKLRRKNRARETKSAASKLQQ